MFLKKIISCLGMAVLAFSFFSCGEKKDAKKDSSKKIVIGFSQIGAESAWRVANTKSVQDSAKAAGVELVYADAQQKKENQIKALQSFITQKVDIIAFSPVDVSGWDDILAEAKKAKIPVILTDRAIDTKDNSLFVSVIGADFTEEGRKAARWLGDYLKTKKKTGSVSIVELRGSDGSAPAIERKKGFEEIMKADYSSWKIVKSENGDFTRAKGQEIMASIIKSRTKFNVLYAHNDDMALGAIIAMEAAGLKPGKDITVLSIDATKGGFEAMIAGKINCVVECSPLLGPQLMKAAKEVVEGKTIPARIITEEGVFPAEVAAKELPNRQY